MRIFPVLTLLFFLVPLVEIYLLIKVGQSVGALLTILLVIGTAVLGVFLLRQQGLSTFSRVQNALSQGRPPAAEMLEGVLLLVGGLLLLTPGFFTDFIGFLCLIPISRQAIVKLWVHKIAVKASSSGGTVDPLHHGVFQQYSSSPSRSTHSANSANTGAGSQAGHRPTKSGAGDVLEGEYTRKDES